jgi:hypothetical protein
VKDAVTLPDEAPYAQITQKGRWTWLVSIHHDLMVYGPDGYGWTVFGRKRAERLAHRQLARYLQRERRPAETIRIEAPSRGEEATA